MKPAEKINLGSSMMIRARLSEEEYKRLRILALEKKITVKWFVNGNKQSQARWYPVKFVKK